MNTATQHSTSGPDVKTPRNPVRHVLCALADLTQDGIAFARRLYDAAVRPATGPDETLRRDQTNYLLYRAMLAIRYAVALTRRMAADPAYRGEPARPTRGPRATAAATPYHWSPAPPTTIRRLQPRPFEQVFAGRSVGQIVDYIRHTLGMPGCVGPLIDEQLARPTEPESNPTPKSRASLPPFLAMLRRAAPSLVPPLAAVAISPGTGPPD